MMKLSALAIAAVLALPMAAQAQKLDLTTMRCRQLIQVNKDNLPLIASWLIGYYSDASDPEVLDLAKMKEVSEKLAQFCAEHPNFVVAGAAEGFLSRQ